MGTRRHDGLCNSMGVRSDLLRKSDKGNSQTNSEIILVIISKRKQVKNDIQSYDICASRIFYSFLILTNDYSNIH